MAIIILLCTSCQVNKFLEEDDYLVTNNQVILEDTENAVKEKSLMKYELSTLIKQEPNNKFLFFFRPELRWHFNYQLKKEQKEIDFEKKFARKAVTLQKKVEEQRLVNDRKIARLKERIEKDNLDPDNVKSAKKIERWNKKLKEKSESVAKKKSRRLRINESWRNRIHEAPVLLDKEVMEETKVSMENYLKNKGFFDAKVFPSNNIVKEKRTRVTYKVVPGNLYKVDTLILESKDPTLDSLKAWLSQETLLTKGKPVDVGLYNQEVVRITDSLRNNGYAFFYPNNVKPLETDTIGYGYDLTIYDELLKPFEGEFHRKYKIGKINIYPNFKGELGVPHRDTVIDGIHFKTIDGDIGIKPKLIRNNVYLNEGEVFNQSLISITNRQLNGLGVYKFVNIRTSKSKVYDDEIDVEIILSKLKKQNITLDGDINNSERFLTNVSNIFVGLSSNISYINRNTFNGAERLKLSLEGGVEFNWQNRDSLINSVDLLGSIDMRLPEFIDIPKTWKILSLMKFGNKSLINPDFLKSMKRNGIPTASLSWNRFSLLGFYAYNSASASFSYDLKRSATEKYTIQTLGLTLFQSQTEPAFDRILIDNPLLEKRLSSRLITGLLYSKFNYLWTSPQSNLGETWQWRFNHELSGAEALLANYIFKGGKQPFSLPNDLEFAHFTKFEFDIRYFKQFRDGNVFGVRADLGVAVPFSGLSQTVPFVKQFFVGGPNSIRAWRIRELGPGEYRSGTTDPPFFQTGDFKFIFNMEYRFKFIPFLNMDGAIFLDGGNIWTLKEDPDRPGSQLLWRSQEIGTTTVGDNFIDQMALGSGAGLRVDFTYFVLTLDVGLKIRSPYKFANGKNWYFKQYQHGKVSDFLNFNLLFGYPF